MRRTAPTSIAATGSPAFAGDDTQGVVIGDKGNDFFKELNLG
jgi:hypothetical protein